MKRGRPPKNLKSNYGEPSDSEPSVIEELPPDAVTVEIEGHETETGPKSFRDRLTEKLTSLTQEDNLSGGEETIKKHRGRPRKNETETEFATLVSSLFVVIVAVWRAPENIKPNEIEIDGVSNRVSRMILRHVDISGRITADVLDLFGIITIGASWYARVAPAIREYNNQPSTVSPQRSAVSNQPSAVSDNGDRWVTPIESADPNLKSWLDRAASGEE